MYWPDSKSTFCCSRSRHAQPNISVSCVNRISRVPAIHSLSREDRQLGILTLQCQLATIVASADKTIPYDETIDRRLPLWSSALYHPSPTTTGSGVPL